MEVKKLLLGIDEVGRGPWAGPLVVGAVILGHHFVELAEYEELADSKQLSANCRQRLSAVIWEQALGVGLGWVPAAEIDRVGLGPALRLAALRAVQDLAQDVQRRAEKRQKILHVDEIVIDGTINFLAGTPLDERVTLLPKADDLVKEVSAASIVAKVARDQYMIELGAKYPGYGFERHMGYGTAVHRQAIEQLGPCAEHRLSIKPLRKYAASMQISPKSAQANTSGKLAEDAVVEYLMAQGQQIVARNFKTKTYEIDIISTYEDKIYFTEVKYRKNANSGTPLEQITARKRQQMVYAARAFLAKQRQFGQYQPLLAGAGVTGVDFKVSDWVVLGSEIT